MDFKFFKGKNNLLLELEPIQLLSINRQTFIQENVEFCFQFDNEEPVVFAIGPNECSIRLNPTSNAEMTFTNNGREFKLFARERQND